MNSNRTDRPLPWRIALATMAGAAFLVACGGSDDTPGPADQYVGTWVSSCEATQLVAADDPDQALKATYQLTLRRVDQRTLRFALDYRVYPATGCQGTPLARHLNEAEGNTWRIDGAQAVGGTQAERITVEMAALGGPTNDGEPVVVNGVRYPADFFIASVHANKDLVAVTEAGLRFGTGQALDAEGYPAALDAEPRLVRQ